MQERWINTYLHMNSQSRILKRNGAIRHDKKCNNSLLFTKTCIALHQVNLIKAALWRRCNLQAWLSLDSGWMLAEWTGEAAWMLENGTSTEYLIEWSSWTTTLEMLRNDNLRRWFPPELSDGAPHLHVVCCVFRSMSKAEKTRRKGWEGFRWVKKGI